MLCLVLSLSVLAGKSFPLFNNPVCPQAESNLNLNSGLNITLVQKYTVALNWTRTSSDLNYFEVERSLSGDAFETLALVMGPEAEYAIQNNFKFKDNSNQLREVKEAWYRIKEIDNQGNISYTKAQKISFIKTEPLVSVFPNPFLEKLQFKFSEDLTGAALIRILNINGEILTTRTVNLFKGHNEIEISDLASYPNGMYIVEISRNGIVTERQKIIKK